MDRKAEPAGAPETRRVFPPASPALLDPESCLFAPTYDPRALAVESHLSRGEPVLVAEKSQSLEFPATDLAVPTAGFARLGGSEVGLRRGSPGADPR
jgi:hypothetical protein